ncbi:VOC family protein [Acidicapsa acidisoli]|uniref:VOC family protein n=1 Tax=Acidicapsa acidisoli TaxID=1615681 RepID=UPI0021DFF14B|nr:VOC family protein [Acidicapsa acidisoli]
MTESVMIQTRKVPEGYHSVQPYLMFVNTREAMAFFAKVFGAKEKLCMQSPEGRVHHAEIAIGDSVVMMADENPAIEAFAASHYGGSPVSVMVYVDDCDTTYAKALEAGATSLREPADQPYGDRMAGILDPFGYKWWVAHSLANNAQRGTEEGQ